MSSSLYPKLPPLTPPRLPPQLIKEIPKKREEILHIESELDVSSTEPKNQKKGCFLHWAMSILAVFFLAVGLLLLAYTWQQMEFQLKSTNITVIKKGPIVFFVEGADTVSISPDSMKCSEEEKIEFTLTARSQEIRAMSFFTDEEFHLKPVRVNHTKYGLYDCVSESEEICVTLTVELPFSQSAMEPLSFTYTFENAERHEIIEFDRTFIVEIAQDQRKALIMENVLRRVFNGTKWKKSHEKLF